MRTSLLLSIISIVLFTTAMSRSGSAAEGNTFTIGEGKLTLTAPANWTKKEPTSRIVEVEFSVPPAKGDEALGRLTGMGAGGSVESNIDRWVGQFVGAGGAPPKPKLD